MTRRKPSERSVYLQRLVLELYELRQSGRITPEKESELKEEIVKTGEGLIINYAWRTYLQYSNNPRIDMEDLIQVGYVALLKALDCFKPGKNTQFTTYATLFIKRYMERYASKNTSGLSFTHDGLSTMKRICALRNQGFSLEEISQITERRLDVVRGILVASSEIRLDSFVSNNGSRPEPLYSFLGENDPMPEKQISYEEVREAIGDCLSEIERQVIHLRYFEGHTLEETGYEIGRVREGVRQIESRALRKLRAHLEGKGPFKKRKKKTKKRKRKEKSKIHC